MSIPRPTLPSLAIATEPSSPARPAALGLVWILPVVAVLQVFWHVSLFYGLLLGSTAALYAAFVQSQERRSVFELSGGWAGFREATLGIAVGLAVATAGALVPLLTGYAELVAVTDLHAYSISLGATVFTIGAVIYEEVLYRGVILRYAELWLGSWIALVPSSLLFTAAHYLGGPQTPTTLMGHAAAGLLFGAGYLLTRRLWLPIGLHLGVNIGATIFFGWVDTTPVFRLCEHVVVGDLSWALAKLIAAAILLIAAARRGRLVRAANAWPEQCGTTAPVPSVDQTAAGRF
jgi:membrane protease YdiL (CAAX protease family)